MGKNVQTVQTSLNYNKREITQSHLIQWFTSRTISLKPQNQDSKSAVARRVGSSPTPGTIRFHDKRPSSRMAFCFSALAALQSIFCAMRHSTPEGSYRQNSFMRQGWVAISVTLTP